MVAPRGRELLDEDGWVFVRIDGENLHLFRKGDIFIYYNPSSDTFGKITLGDPKQKPPN